MPIPEDDNDKSLLLKVAADDTAAFDQLYKAHWQPMYKLALYFLKDEAAAMDIVQDVFVWIWQQRQQIKVHTSVQAYLKTAVKYKLANYIRSGKVRQDLLDNWVMETTYTHTGQDSAELRELKAIIQQTIEGLPEKCREVFTLSRNHGLTNQQIAEKLGISVKTVENQMTIALRRLRAHTREYMVLLLVAILSR
ncbi:MAG: RNA polymerase sigma-70 factor [Bacteroidetes bacterium]|uniref:RNA polymerase sigma-70 factor n=1 Tax=Phnomibacter sp. TaxID=2836217 RepID=UPI002FDEDEBA|nr:RNA polymerase sigma-70 factor [Bacteroidota bacterium]MCC6763017.1 RNA polymerase sigma-70 factor [Chitinophagaceae bacterium]